MSPHSPRLGVTPQPRQRLSLPLMMGSPAGLKMMPGYCRRSACCSHQLPTSTERLPTMIWRFWEKIGEVPKAREEGQAESEILPPPARFCPFEHRTPRSVLLSAPPDIP